MKNVILRKAELSHGGRRSKGSITQSKCGAVVIIEGVKFTSEEPMNDAHADYINSMLETLEK